MKAIFPAFLNLFQKLRDTHKKMRGGEKTNVSAFVTRIVPGSFLPYVIPYFR